MLLRFLRNLRWMLPLALVLAAVLGISSSVGSAGTLGDLVITPGPQTFDAGTASQVITVTRENSGVPVTTGETTINLGTDSSKGAFREADRTTPLTPAQVTIHAGDSSADFTYYDEAAGTPRITATDAGGDGGYGSVDQTETVNPASATHLSVTAPSTATAGIPFSVTVTAIDQFDNTATGYMGTIQFSSSDTKTSTSLPATYPFVGADNGTHTFADAATLTTAGNQTISAGDGTLNATSGGIQVAPGPLHHFTWTGEPSGTQHAGADITATVKAYDQFGNVKTDYNGSTASFSGLSNAPNASASASYDSFTAGVDDGPFKTYKTENTAITVSDGAASATSSTTFDVGPGSLGSFDWSEGQPVGPYKAGDTISATVKAYDTFGNFKSDYGASGSSVFSGLSSSIGGCTGPTQPCAPSYPDFSGGTASGFKDFRAENGVAITATANSVAFPSNSFAVGPAAATHLSVPTPATQTAGHPFAVTLTALDPWENVDTNFAGGSAGFSGPTFSSPNNSHPTYPGSVTFSNGQGTAAGISLVKAESTSLTATVAGISGTTPAAFTVLPGDLANFTIDAPTVVGEPAKPARAGHDSTATVKAFDAFGNLKTNYNPTTAPALTGDLSNSTTGCGTGNAQPCQPIYNGVGSFSGGQATATFRPFKKESGVHITATDTSLSKSGTSAAFAVSPGDLDHFTVSGPIPALPSAGHAATVSVTAYDAFGNVKDDYAGAPVMTGTLSTASSGCGGGGNSPCPPTYGVGAFSSGIATGTFTPFVATEPGPPAAPTSEANRDVTVSDGPHNGMSPNFNVQPGEPKSLTFLKEPTETCNAKVNTAVCVFDNSKSAIINGAATGVQVRAVDGFGNNAYNTSVKLALAAGFNPGSTTLKGTTTQPAGTTGIAVFNDLRIEVVGIGYRLAATAPPTGATAGPTNSRAFKIAQTVTTCTTTCSGTGSDQPNSSVSVSVTGNHLTGNTLGIALAGMPSDIPSGVCNNWAAAPNAPGSYVDVNTVSDGAAQPTLTITWKIPKSVVSKIPNIPNNINNGASHYDICLGSANQVHPDGVGVTGWPTKDGGPAIPKLDTNFGVVFFWGIIPDCPKKGAIVNPCMQSRSKDSSGNLILTYITPYPWDPGGFAGGHI